MKKISYRIEILSEMILMGDSENRSKINFNVTNVLIVKVCLVTLFPNYISLESKESPQYCTCKFLNLCLSLNVRDQVSDHTKYNLKLIIYLCLAH